jgi:hypothetical protein
MHNHSTDQLIIDLQARRETPHLRPSLLLLTHQARIITISDSRDWPSPEKPCVKTWICAPGTPPPRARCDPIENGPLWRFTLEQGQAALLLVRIQGPARITLSAAEGQADFHVLECVFCDATDQILRAPVLRPEGVMPGSFLTQVDSYVRPHVDPVAIKHPPDRMDVVETPSPLFPSVPEEPDPHDINAQRVYQRERRNLQLLTTERNSPPSFHRLVVSGGISAHSSFLSTSGLVMLHVKQNYIVLNHRMKTLHYLHLEKHALHIISNTTVYRLKVTTNQQTQELCVYARVIESSEGEGSLYRSLQNTQPFEDRQRRFRRDYGNYRHFFTETDLRLVWTMNATITEYDRPVTILHHNEEAAALSAANAAAVVPM